MGKKRLSFEFFGIYFILLFSFLLRLVVFKKFKYYPDIDTYAFLYHIEHNIHNNIFIGWLGNIFGLSYMWLVLGIIFLITVLLFYIICRKFSSINASLISTFLYGISPIIFWNSKLGLIDKNVPTLLMLMIGILIVLYVKNIYYQIGLSIINLALFSIIWEGWWGLLVTLLFYYFFKYIIFNKSLDLKHKIFVYFLMFIGILFIIRAAYPKLLILLSYSSRNMTSELAPLWKLGILFSEYIIIIFVYLYVFARIKKDKKDMDLLNKYLILYIGFIIWFFPFVYIFRLNIFFIPFLYIWFSIMFDDLEYTIRIKNIISIVLILFIMLTSINFYFHPPDMNDGIKETMDYINTLDNDCIVNMWSLGHIYQYYTNKKVMFKATSSHYRNELNLFVYGNVTSDCIYLWSNNDIRGFEYMLLEDGIDLNISDYYIMNIEPDITFYYNYTRYGNREYYVYNPKGDIMEEKEQDGFIEQESDYDKYDINKYNDYEEDDEKEDNDLEYYDEDMITDSE